MPSRRFVLRRHGRASQLRCEPKVEIKGEVVDVGKRAAGPSPTKKPKIEIELSDSGRASQLRCELPPPPHELRSPAEPERGALCRCEQEGQVLSEDPAQSTFK
jgi:hypothetical protein